MVGPSVVQTVFQLADLSVAVRAVPSVSRMADQMVDQWGVTKVVPMAVKWAVSWVAKMVAQMADWMVDQMAEQTAGSKGQTMVGGLVDSKVAEMVGMMV